MRRSAALAAVVVVVAAGGALALDAPARLGAGPTPEATWLSETGVPATGNHHGAAVGDGLVVVPIGGERGTTQCRAVALEAADGHQRWSHPIPPDECSIHAVGSIALADVDADGVGEALVPTGEDRVVVLDPSTGEPALTVALSTYGYARPVVGPLGPGGERRLVAVDAAGSVVAVRPDGSVAWTHDGASEVWADPAVADVTGDGRADLVVGFGAGRLATFGPGGSVGWNRSLPSAGRLTWLATGDLDGDAVDDVVVSTEAGGVHAFAGPDGEHRWSRSIGRLAAVGAVADADGDGVGEVYVTASDGRLRSLDGASGRTRWARSLADDPGQVTPPPVVGEVDGDPTPELIAATHGGRVHVLEPTDGGVVATYARGGPLPWSPAPPPIWTHPTVADADGDGIEEIYVVYGDGRVAALTYDGS